MPAETPEQIKVILERSPVAMLVSAGSEQRVLMVNRKFTELFGYTIDDIPDVEHWWPLAYPDEAYRDEIRREWNTKVEWATANRTDIEPVEAIVTCKNGSRRFIKFHLSPIGDSASNLLTFFDITERKRQQEALSDSESRYQEIIESSRDGFVMVDPEGRFLDCNQAYLQMLGYTREELLKLPDFYAITPEKWRQWEREEIWEKRLLSRGYSGLYEKEYIRKDGSIFQVELSSHAIRDSQGGLKYAWGIARDVTVQKRMEAALRESEEKYRTLVEMANDAILLTAPDGRIFSANPAACRMLGHSEEEICELGRAGLVVSDKKLEAAIASRKQSGSHTAELTMRRSGGETFPADVSSSVFQTEDGELRTSMVIRDISERKQAARDLRKSEERYRTLFEDSRDMIMMTTPAGKFLDINHAGVELLGYDSREEILHLDSVAGNLYQDPEDRSRMLSEMQRQGFLKDFGLKYKTKDGKVLDVSATLTPILGDDGEIAAIRGIVRDMTAHNLLEAQVRQSQRLESIGLLAGGVAHEFNNKLTAIMGNIDMALMQLPEGGETREDLEAARRSSDQAADIVRQLLAFSRHETMQPKPLSLNDVLDDTLRMLERIIGDPYNLETSYDESAWSVCADISYIGQVIMNLVVNARDAMPCGGTITIKTRNRMVDDGFVANHPGSRNGRFVQVSVSDTGEGIDPKSLPRIFEPFYSTKDVSEGTGLGLSVVYGIVTDHKGWINVHSQPGAGTTFDLFLPACEQAQPAP